MEKLLFVGVTCADVIINVDHLPRTAEDVVVFGQQMALGGCAFNAFSAAHALDVPATLFSPVGTGAFGDFVRTQLGREGIPVAVENPARENGCCYCFVEPGGERTFIAYHGADYHYERAWLDALDMEGVEAVYACGLEVEDPTGPVVVDFLERRTAGATIFFTSGPRPDKLPLDLLNRVLDLHPVLHMNGDEAIATVALLGLEAPQGASAAGNTGETVAGDVSRDGAPAVVGAAGEVGMGDAATSGLPAIAPADGCATDACSHVPAAICTDASPAVAPASVVRAAAALRERTGSTVIATLGERGCYYDAGDERGVVPGVPTQVVDTIGAGDAHIGAVMACLARGDALPDALACANRISSAVVASTGAHLAPAAVKRAAAGC